jgi:hypothetical protein
MHIPDKQWKKELSAFTFLILLADDLINRCLLNLTLDIILITIIIRDYIKEPSLYTN